MGKKISLGTAVTLILIAIAITFTFTTVFSLRNFNEKVNSITERENMFSKFTEIDNNVRINHNGKIDEDVLMDSVAKGYLSGINDPYAKYMNPKEYAAYLASIGNTVAGVGISVSMDTDGYMLVDSVYESSTAASAGIVSGDLIVKIDDINLSSDTFAQAEALLTGEAGTKVTLTVRRDNEDTEMEITRRVLTPTTVFTTVFNEIFHYIRISDFSESTPEQFSKAVETSISEGAAALIIDVRFVNTGIISAAAEMVDKMAGEGDMLYVEYGDRTETLFVSNARETDIPLVIITNETTAGAAEFFAASLRDFGKAKIVGVQTDGVGSLQEILKLSDGSAIQLTVGKYILANSNVEWEGTGVTPDHAVATPTDYVIDLSDITFLDPGIDPQLAKAIEVASSSVILEESDENPEENGSEG